jgi:tRNA U38,U39,U40 pseudouridine synthase TruA
MADLLAARDRGRAGRTAPAHGLTLERVLYSV